MRQVSRRTLVEQARARYARQPATLGQVAEGEEKTGAILDPDALTLGFARRFVAYKRPTLLLHDPERLVRILAGRDCPVQLILAGKAHPADREGQDMIRQWVSFTKRADVRGRAVFLSDYDMLLTEQLVGGVDVWINTPRRPWEACGTSGMKVLANGGLNLSELDGWWAEAYSPEVGWAIGDGREHDDDPAWDAAEAGALYTLLENDVIPQFYQRDAHGIPAQWVARIRKSMARLTASFSANRAVREYTRNWYVPAAIAYDERRADNGSAGAEMVRWRQSLEKDWPSMQFLGTHVETAGGEHRFRVEVDLGAVNPASVTVELYAENLLPGEAPFRQKMAMGEKTANGANSHIYTSQVPSARPPGDFTPRIIPNRPGLSVPLELALILWQR